MGRIKKRVFEIVSSAQEGDQTSFWFDMVIIGFIILSVVELILVTVPGMLARFFWAFIAVEIVTAVVFTIEYILRMWSCTADVRYQKPVTCRITSHYSFQAQISHSCGHSGYFASSNWADIRVHSGL